MASNDYKYAESFVQYFEENRTNNDLFDIEAKVARSIVDLMKKKKRNKEDLRSIRDQLKGIEKVQHYDGTGWLQFKKAVDPWLKNEEKRI
jgi:hypothetical protein